MGTAAAAPRAGSSGYQAHARNRLWTGSGRIRGLQRPESLAEAYAGLDRLLIITTVDPEPGKRGAQNVAAIDAAVKVDQVVPYRLPAESKISPPMGQPPSAPPVKLWSTVS